MAPILKSLFNCFILIFALVPLCNTNSPVVITTWNFVKATEEAWRTIRTSSALDAIEAGCSMCEAMQCDGTVGFGGSPDENGETVLDAMIFDGRTMNVGSVISLRRVKHAISVARRVLDHTAHSILAGDLATEFALRMGFNEESLSTNHSVKLWNDWRNNRCQPNYWLNVKPDPMENCGPYAPIRVEENSRAPVSNNKIDENNHDTIGMVAIDKNGDLAAGTSTNGMTHKIAGRVADSAIPGSGGYADNGVGAAAATGDGDVMLRFSPSFMAVENMRRGMSPIDAAKDVVGRIAKFYPTFSGAVVALGSNGGYGAACHGMNGFPYTVAKEGADVTIENVNCETPSVVQL